MTKRLSVLIAVVALAVAAAYYWNRPRRPVVLAPAAADLRSAERLSSAHFPSLRAVSPAAAPTRRLTVDYRRLVANSNDYWALAHQLLSAANAGDPNAAFYLSDILSRCASGATLYLQQRGANLAPDQVIQWASKRHLSLETAQSVYQRCHAFVDNDVQNLGSEAGWLAKATAAGQPLAQATTAEQALMQASVASAAQEHHFPAPDLGYQLDPATDARALLLAAAQSGDPQVYFKLGEMQLLLHPDQSDSDTITNELAWWVVACERGFDCSSNADWVRNACILDATCVFGAGLADYVQSLSGDLWPDVEQRAHDIGIQLDLGQWNALGIGT